MSERTRFLMAQVTDVYGDVEAEGVTVEHLDGGWVEFGMHDGTRWLFEVSELARAVAPDAEERAA